jgi:hypothetical protein
MNAILYTVTPRPVRAHFTRVASPTDPRLKLLGELIDDTGRRVWAGFGQHEAEILAHAAAWFDNSHGRAAHTPLIEVDETWPHPLLARVIQETVQQAQAARLL